jgi:hypothetical protein
MKISKDSWHVKMHEKFGNTYPSEISGMSLCKYFWLTVWCFIKTLFLILGSIVVLVLLFIVTVVIPITFLITGITDNFLQEFNYELAFAITMVEAIVVLMVGWEVYKQGAMKLYPSYLNFIFKRFSSKTKEVRKTKYKEPSLVVEWIKAKKSKVCPMIEVVDND